MEEKQIYSAYDDRSRVKATNKGCKGRTKQEFKDECNVNNILKQYDKTGVIEHLSNHEGFYTEVNDVDFQQAQDIIADGNSMFEGLPSGIRKKFDNAPEKFLEFMHDESNIDEAIKLGLVSPQRDTESEARGKVMKNIKEKEELAVKANEELPEAKEGGKKKA